MGDTGIENTAAFICSHHVWMASIVASSELSIAEKLALIVHRRVLVCLKITSCKNKVERNINEFDSVAHGLVLLVDVRSHA
jgi:hypothetical protein